MEFLRKLFNGEYTLEKTYWLYGVMFNMTLFIFIARIPIVIYTASGTTSLPFFIGFSIYLIYNIIFSIGLWNSATKYGGLVIWKLLSKFSAIINFVFIVLCILFVGYLILESLTS